MVKDHEGGFDNKKVEDVETGMGNGEWEMGNEEWRRVHGKDAQCTVHDACHHQRSPSRTTEQLRLRDSSDLAIEQGLVPSINENRDDVGLAEPSGQGSRRQGAAD